MQEERTVLPAGDLSFSSRRIKADGSPERFFYESRRISPQRAPTHGLDCRLSCGHRRASCDVTIRAGRNRGSVYQPHRPSNPKASHPYFSDLEHDHRAGPLALAASALLRLLPGQRRARQRAGRLPQHRPGRPRPLLAGQPGLTELEEVVTDWVRQMVGLSEAWSGVIQDTASTSTLVALLCARERTSGLRLSRGGLQAEERPLIVYTSDQSHSSVEKAALLAGFGRDNVRTIAHDAHYALRPEALDAAMRRDLRRGRTPCAIVATTGTTATTALDPLAAIAEVAAPHGLWLHVDAAMAGSAMILPECRWMWQGIEAADSLVLNAHKWLGVAFDCSLYYVRSRASRPVMSTNPSYLQIRGGRPGQEPARLGHPAGATLSRAQALVSDPRAGRGRAAGPSAPRSRECRMAGRAGSRHTELAGAGSRAAANCLRAPRTAGSRG